MKRTSRLSALTCVLLCVIAMSAPAVAAPAATVSAPVALPKLAGSGSGGDLATRKAAVQKALAIANSTYEGASAQVQAAAAKYAQANAELPGAREDLANAVGSVNAASADVDQANAAVTTAEAAEASATAEVTADNNQVLAERAAISAVVTSVYRGSSFLELDSLLSGGTPDAMLQQLGDANQIVVSQQKTLNRYVAARLTAKYAQNRATTAAQAATTAQRTAATDLVRSQRAQATAQTAQTAVTALVAARKAALTVALKFKTTALAQYNELAKENRQVETQLAEQAAADKAAAKRSKSGSTKSSKSPPATSPSSGGRSGYFIMPVHGWMSSPFGMRFDPIYKRWQLHAGVDIAVGTGTPIHAARAGKVIRAGWDGGYGNYTCVDTGLYEGTGADHGKDIANCYAHQSRILVHVGEHVSLGQTIGLVGETGAATGPHLHFEVRIDGTPVQPLNWLPKCFC
jgi:murein DD-endopeptidase MepM/ murein hydrolase activator NlpD